MRHSLSSHDNGSAQDMKGALLRLVRMLRPESVRIAGTVIFTLFGTVAMVAAPKLLGDTTNVIVDGAGAGRIDSQLLASLLLIVCGLYVLHAVTNIIGGALSRIAVQNLGYRLRMEAQAKIDRLPLSYLDQHKRGDLLSRVTNDIDNIVQTLMQALNQSIVAIYTVIGILAFMFYLSWSLALWSLLVLPFGMLAIMKILHVAAPAFREQSKKTGEVSSVIDESFSGHDVVSAFGMENEVNDVFDNANNSLFSAGFRGYFLSMLAQPLTGFISNLSFVIVAVIGGIQVLNGTLTIGGIQAFLQYSRQLNNPVGTIASMSSMLQSSAASGERIFDFLDTPEMEPETGDTVALPSTISGAVTFDRITYGYTPNKPVIQDLSLHVQGGQQVAIVGPTGAGKTTLVNLVMRFYDPDSGTISLDGRDIRTIPKATLRSRTGMVLQDTWLFDGTIEENIAFGREGSSHDDVVAAARAVGIDRMIRQLPNGYNTRIDDESGELSRGKKQLVTIARAYISQPNILILDEATSSVDTRTEMLVAHAMGELRHGRTSFIIAHRLSTIKDADVILVMVDGNVVEQGTHETLLAQRGHYYSLYQSQFSTNEEE